MVARRQIESDRRRTYVHITDAGRTRIAELQFEATERERIASNALTPAESRQLKELLRKLIGLGEANEARSSGDARQRQGSAQ